MNSYRKKEKRLYPRRPIKTQVIFENEDSEGSLYFFSTDISEGGIFLETDLSIQLETQVFLKFRLTPQSKSIQATGEVVRVMREQNKEAHHKKSKTGIGVKFIYIHPLDRQIIHDFVSQWNAEAPVLG